MLLMAAAGLLAATTDGDAQGPTPAVWEQADSVVALSGTRLIMRASAWRDFMPSMPPRGDGSDLMISIQVVAVDSELPPGVRVDSAWVRSHDHLWTTAPSRESRPDIPRGIDLMLRGGPRWRPGRTVDVLVRVRLPGGRVAWLQQRAVPIGRVS